MHKIAVRFMTLTGRFAAASERVFPDLPSALAAVEEHAAAAGFSSVKVVDEGDGDGVRFTARTPGGRSGRNVAFGDFVIEGDEEVSS